MSMPTNVITVIFGLFVYTAVTEKAYPQDLETEKALELITTTADKICSAVNTDGSSDSKKVTGAVNAQLNGLIRSWPVSAFLEMEVIALIITPGL